MIASKVGFSFFLVVFLFALALMGAALATALEMVRFSKGCALLAALCFALICFMVANADDIPLR